MKQVIIRETCDRCGDTFDEGATTTIPIGWVNRTLYETDVCDSCIDDFLSEFRVVNRKPGRKPAQASIPKEIAEGAVPYTCGWSGRRGACENHARAGYKTCEVHRRWENQPDVTDYRP